MKTATLKKANLPRYTGTAHLYELSEPIGYNGNQESKFVVVSATSFMTGAETYIFPAEEGGEVINWGELDGSFKGSLDHHRALEGAGYSVI